MDKIKRTAEEIGMKLRDARVSANMTLADVATRAQMSESSLSRIERGNTTLSVTNLIELCDILNINFNDMFNSANIPAKTAVSVHRSEGEPEEVVSTGYRWLALAGGAPFDHFNVFLLSFPKDEQMKLMVSHPGQEYCYVLDGSVDFYVGDQVHRLTQGDGIMIDSQLPHRAERVGVREAHVLMVVSKNGDHAGLNEWWNIPARRLTAAAGT